MRPVQCSASMTCTAAAAVTAMIPLPGGISVSPLNALVTSRLGSLLLLADMLICATCTFIYPPPASFRAGQRSSVPRDKDYVAAHSLITPSAPALATTGSSG